MSERDDWIAVTPFATAQDVDDLAAGKPSRNAQCIAQKERPLVEFWRRLRDSLSEGSAPRAAMSEDEDSIAVYFGNENHFEIEFNEDGTYSVFAMKKGDDASSILFPEEPSR